MRSKNFESRAGLLALFLTLVLLAGPRTALATSYTWTSGVSGSIADATKWTPNGTPWVLDKLTFSPAGTYTVTFPTTVPQTNMVTLTNGNVTFSVSATHSTGGFAVYPNSLANSLTLSSGTFNINYLELGTSGFNSMTVSADTRASKTALVHSNGAFNPHGGGDVIGYGGISELTVTGGGRYICESTGANNGLMRMADQPSSAATLSISGSSSFFPQTVSSLQLTGGASLTVGVNGSANLFASNKGYIDETGDMFVATNSGSNGYITIGPSTSGTSYLEAHQKLLVGSNGTSSVAAGHGELTIKNNGLVRVTGACEVADADNGASGNTSVIRVQQGGNLTILGGIRFFSAGRFDLQGGLVHVKSGLFQHAGILTISSQTGTPTLVIDNQERFNQSPSLLYVGRSGNGTFRLSGTQTWMPNIGTVVVGDSVGGVGTIDQDSVTTFATISPFNIGVRGHGTWNIQHGSGNSIGTLAVGIASGGVGAVNISGSYGSTYSDLSVNDNLWIGGGFGGPGGTGTVTVGAGCLLRLFPSAGQSTTLLTLYGPPASSSLDIHEGAQFISGFGDVSNGGTITLTNGSVYAPHVTVTNPGKLNGYGTISYVDGTCQNGGRVDPFTPTSVMGMFNLRGSFLQTPSGHYLVNLDTSGGQVSDYMIVKDTATLGGTLDLTTGPGFNPGPGETFPILFCGSRTGTFAAVTWNGQPLAGEATIEYGSTLVNVVMPGVSAVGDPGSPASLPAVLRFASLGTPQHPGFALELPQTSEVTVKVYDVCGREVATLLEGTVEAGRRRLGFENVKDLASGTYFARAAIRSENGTTVKTARTILVH